MKKFLSILALVCLLALGMALPAAAEGTDLFAAFSEGGPATVVLSLPKDITRPIYFFKTPDSTPDRKPVTDGTFTKTGDEVEFSLVDGVYQVTGLEVTKEPVRIGLDDSGLSSVEINVVPSQFQVKVDGGKWGTSLPVLTESNSVGVQFRFGAESVYDDVISESITVAPASGLSLEDGKLSANAAGDYTLKYNTYTISVKVRARSTVTKAEITNDELVRLKDSETDFVRFLCEQKGYSGSGDFTLLLPSGNFGDVECNAQLPNGANLILKGAEGKNTSIKGLTIRGKNVSVDGIVFNARGTAITLNSPADGVCRVTNCVFTDAVDSVFSIQQTSGKTPKVRLQGNVIPEEMNVNLVYSDVNEVGKWQIKPGTKTADISIDFSAGITRYEKGAIKLSFGDKKDAVKSGWTFKFETNRPNTFTSAYAVYNGKEKTELKLLSGGKILVTAPNKGTYAVVKGTYPVLSNGKVTITDAAAIGLTEVTVSTKFSDASVKKGTQKVFSAVNSGKLTFQLNGAGTYTVTELKNAATKTTTTKTTSRSYKSTYQDFYQVTPAGFTNAMRYVQDNLVTLNCTEAGKRSISLPVASMAAAAEKGYSVLVKTKSAELTLDAAALKSIAQQAKGTTVLLHYKSLNHKTLTTVGQASIQSHLDQFPGDNADLAFLVTATSDSETIEDLQMGTITLRIPFIILPGTEGMTNTVYALQSESISEARETTVADGHLTTKLLDLTEHMVFLTTKAVQPTEETTEPETTEPTEETTEPARETTEVTQTTQPETVPETTQPAQPAEETGGSPILTVVLVLGAVLVIGGALGFLLLRKRFRK